MHADDAFDARDFREQKALVLVHVGDGDLELVIGFLAGDQVALLYLGVAAHDALELREALGRVPIHADVDERREIETERARRKKHGAFANHARTLELIDRKSTRLNSSHSQIS